MTWIFVKRVIYSLTLSFLGFHSTHTVQESLGYDRRSLTKEKVHE